MTARDLYNQDFFAWTVRNAELLRAARLKEADLEHVAEEIEDMGKSQRRSLTSRLEVLLMRLLKWEYQPNRRGPSWKATIKLQRSKITELLVEMPSLRRPLQAGLAKPYQHAVLMAAGETDLPEDHFPASCPFTLKQALDPGFFPQ